MKNRRISQIVSEIILNQEGKFLVKDILNKTKSLVGKEFTTMEELRLYIIKKLDLMCEIGLLGKISLYYFSI